MAPHLNLHHDFPLAAHPPRPPVRRPASVKLIPRDEVPDPVTGASTPDVELLLATARLEAARERFGAARSELTAAARAAAEAREAAELARTGYLEAQALARSRDVKLRQRQRVASDAKLELRQAHEELARIECLDGVEDVPPEAASRTA
jgi:hypothetical protein